MNSDTDFDLGEINIPIYIHADAHLTLVAAIIGIVAISLLAERTKIGSRLSAPAILLAVAILLSNLGIIPHNAPIYEGIQRYIVICAIPLLLLKADLRRIIQETGTMLPIFLLAAAFVVIGTLLAFTVIDLGPEKEKIAGTMAATFIGGGMNFVAVSTALQFENKSVLAATLASDNVLSAIYLVLLTMSVAAFRITPGTGATASALTPNKDPEPAPKDQSLLPNITFSLSLAMAIAAMATAIAGQMGVSQYSIPVATLLAVLLANIFPRQLRQLRGDFELGTLMMYVFFITVGASTDLGVFVENSAMIALFILVIFVVHVVLLFGCAILFRFDMAETAIVSNACILGPPTAAVMAASRGWTHLVTPALMCGIAGYTLANFIGITLARLLAP